MVDVSLLFRNADAANKFADKGLYRVQELRYLTDVSAASRAEEKKLATSPIRQPGHGARAAQACRHSGAGNR
jgi:hypothetical protein